MSLLDEAKVLLARHPLIAEAIEQPAAVPRTGADPGVNPAAAPVMSQLDGDGRERLFGFSRIEGFPFVVAYGFDKERALAEWRRRAIQLLLGYTALSLLAALFARAHWTSLRQRDELRASEQRFHTLAENMADIVWTTDAEPRFTYINNADQRVRGYTRDEVIGTPVRDNLTAEGQAMLLAILQRRREVDASAERGTALSYELPMRHKERGEVWVEMSSVPQYASDGSIVGYQGVGRDVSARREYEAHLLQSHQQLEHRLQEVAEEATALQELSTRDPLTGLYNRRFLEDALPRECARALQERKPLAGIMLDLDHFKRVNDEHGHAAGVEVLIALAALLRQGSRDSDLICRFGGEDFVAIMPGMSVAQAVGRVESWRQQLEAATVVVGESRIRVTLSAGVAMVPDHADTPEALLARADAMLYQAKAEGRNRIGVCTTR